MNRLKALQEFGQAVWLDFIRRDILENGELARLIHDDGISGVTSNPAIFHKAIAGSSDYDGQLGDLLRRNPDASMEDLYERLAIRDIHLAADLLRTVYDDTDGADGFVSLEVSPHLADDTDGTIQEARELWRRVDRPNLMIKVPATAAGIPAIEQLLGEAINVNVTLMFSLAHYEAVAQAYLRAMKRCSEPHRVASVASFFVSRVDNKVDQLLEENGSEEALALRGKTAVANSKLTYRRFKQIFYGEPFTELGRRGARVQRVLWASTSTKNPAYSDVLYVDELIGRDTVNTLPPATVEAFRDHGNPHASLEEGMEAAEEQLRRLAALGVDLDVVTEEIQREGVEKFAQPFDQLLAALQTKRGSLKEAKAASPSS